MATFEFSKIVGAYQAKARLSGLLERVEAGEEITITKHGAPVAQSGAREKESQCGGGHRRH